MNLNIILISLMVGIFLFILCWSRTRTVVNFGCMFSLIWTMVLILSNSTIWGYYVPSSKVNGIVLVGTIIFCSLYIIFGINEYCSAKMILNIDCYLNIKLIAIINFIILIFMLPFLKDAVAVLLSNGFMYLRANLMSDISGIVNILFAYVCYPVIQVSILLGFILFFLGKKHAIKILIFSCFNMFVYEMIFAARNGFMIILVFGIFSYLKCRLPAKITGIKNLKRKQKITIALIIVLIVGIVVFISLQRSFKGKSLFETAYIYYVSGPNYLSSLLKNNKISYLYGRATFGFVYNIFAMLINAFGGNVLDTNTLINSQITDVYYNISHTTHINAMSTVYFPFIMDWGYIGIVFGTGLLAFAAIGIARKCKKNNNIRWYALYIYFLYFIYRTIFKSDAISPSFFLVLIYIILFTSRKRMNLKNTFRIKKKL